MALSGQVLTHPSSEGSDRRLFWSIVNAENKNSHIEFAQL
jgi:hypothetical protein